MAAPVNGAARSPEDAAYLATFEKRMQLPIILSAILPLLFVPGDSTGKAGIVGVVVGVVSWLVFLVDYIVHQRRTNHLTRTGRGKFDLIVVIFTAPWFLLPGAQTGAWVLELRLARLIRVLLVSKGARRLLERVGSIALVALGVVLIGAYIAYRAEHPTNPGFATFGDALWWGLVTLTTVGYGDIVPHTTVGRWAGAFIMVTGIGVLGLLSGSLASFFRPSDDATASTADAPGDAPPADPMGALVEQIAALREQVTDLTTRLGDGSSR